MRLITRHSTDQILTRLAGVATTGQANVFTATLSTNADVKRSGYVERLGKWNSFPPRLPLLDSHRRESVEAILGFVDNVRTEGSNIIADVHISSTRSNVAALISEGSLSELSIGFSADRWNESTAGGERIRTGEGLTLREVSLVTLGADQGARFRAEESTADRIRDLAETLRVPSTIAESLVTRGLDFETARAELVREAGTRAPRIDGRAGAYVTRETAPGDHARALGEALASRHGARNTVSELGRAFVHERFPQVCRRMLEVSGVGTMGLSEAAIVKRAMTTSDFPILMGEFLNVILMAGYRAAPSPLAALVKNLAPVSDFRDIHLPRLSQSPILEPILETGEVTFGALADSQETFKVTRWGKGLSISFVVMVNDRLGAISDQIRAWGVAVAQTEAQELIRFLTMNAGEGPTLADGQPLFDAGMHHNVLTPGAPDETTFDAARVAMRRQTDRFGMLLGLEPQYVLVPPEEETAAKKLVATIQPTQTSAVNAFTGWTVLADARLVDAKRYYFFADPNVAPVFVRATLAGFENPQVQTQIDFLTDNIATKVNHNFGFGVADYVGGSTNAGA